MGRYGRFLGHIAGLVLRLVCKLEGMTFMGVVDEIVVVEGNHQTNINTFFESRIKNIFCRCS